MELSLKENTIEYYEERGFDTFKEATSVPGCSFLLAVAFKGVKCNSNLLSKRHSDLVKLFQAKIVGGPALNFDHPRMQMLTLYVCRVPLQIWKLVSTLEEGLMSYGNYRKECASDGFCREDTEQEKRAVRRYEKVPKSKSRISVCGDVGVVSDISLLRCWNCLGYQLVEMWELSRISACGDVGIVSDISLWRCGNCLGYQLVEMLELSRISACGDVGIVSDISLWRCGSCLGYQLVEMWELSRISACGDVGIVSDISLWRCGNCLGYQLVEMWELSRISACGDVGIVSDISLWRCGNCFGYQLVEMWELSRISVCGDVGVVSDISLWRCGNCLGYQLVEMWECSWSQHKGDFLHHNNDNSYVYPTENRCLIS
ncbi:hypothetical protein ACHWQZ_G018521 [Mnemiopsis leidyi]